MLYHGDCLDYMRTMPDDCVDLIVTDPPYEIETHGRGIMRHRDYQEELRPMADGFSPEVLEQMARVMKHVNLYTFCSKRQMPKLIGYFQSHVPRAGRTTR
jgi:site-specific DNA-methyltransferase (adenine-specific)